MHQARERYARVSLDFSSLVLAAVTFQLRFLFRADAVHFSDYGVTPMGDNGAPRKLDAEWCENRHLNGYNKAPRRYIRRL